MSSERWAEKPLGEVSQNASRRFDFKKHPNVIFINTSDVLEGAFLHSIISPAVGLPGQAKKRLCFGDILLTEIRPGNGRFAYVDFNAEEYVVSTKFMVIESTKDIDSRFLYHVLTNRVALNNFQHIAESRSGTFPQITFESIAHYPIPLPPRNEQLKIVQFLDEVNTRIGLLKETNKTLESIAQAIFKSWFVDFDPVRAKMAGRQPDGMDEATAALFPDSFEESEPGLIPKGWHCGQLGDVATTVHTPVSVNEFKESIVYVGLEHVPRKELSLTDWGVAAGLESTKAAFSTKDILFGKLRPYFHKVVVAPLGGVCSTDILVCRPKDSIFHAFVALHLFSKNLIAYADRLSNGAKMPRINWKDLAVYPVIIPPEKIVASYDDAIQTILDKMRANVFQIKTISSLRNALLPRLISGRIRLPDIEQKIEAALP